MGEPIIENIIFFLVMINKILAVILAREHFQCDHCYMTFTLIYFYKLQTELFHDHWVNFSNHSINIEQYKVGDC